MPAAATRQSTAQIATVPKPGTPIVPSWTSSKASDNANRAVPEVEASPMINKTPTTPIRTPVESR